MTLRTLPLREVVEVAAEAGLEAIEWGGDVHVPAGDEAAAHAAREATEAAGLAVASYGSYWRGEGDFADVLASARALAAPRIRVWAGAKGSGEASREERKRVAAATREAAAAAAGPGERAAPSAAGGGIAVAFEFHGGTLADDAASARELADAAGVQLYWQPPEGMPDEQALAGLRLLGDRVAALHVFSWWPGNERRPLAEREALWRQALAHFGDGDALLEFVPGDDPALVAEEARTLRGWLDA